MLNYVGFFRTWPSVEMRDNSSNCRFVFFVVFYDLSTMANHTYVTVYVCNDCDPSDCESTNRQHFAVE